MIEVGNYNTMRVVKEVDFGLYLDGGEEFGEILLPTRYVPENVKPDDELEVFIYLDSEDRIIATTETPIATVGEFTFLQVAAVSKVGAFLDWGLPKDLLLPFREQRSKVKEGQVVLVYIYLDAESKRIVASAKIDKFLDNVPPDYEIGQEVQILISEKSELGYKCIIEETHAGMLYENEIFKKVFVGQSLKAFIKKIRSDDKIDISLQKSGYEAIDGISQKIMNYLIKSGGTMTITDKSSAEEIAQVFGISKKNFKKALGSLYKQKLINLAPGKVEMK